MSLLIQDPVGYSQVRPRVQQIETSLLTIRAEGCQGTLFSRVAPRRTFVILERATRVPST